MGVKRSPGCNCCGGHVPPPNCTVCLADMPASIDLLDSLYGPVSVPRVGSPATYVAFKTVTTNVRDCTTGVVSSGSLTIRYEIVCGVGFPVPTVKLNVFTSWDACCAAPTSASAVATGCSRGKNGDAPDVPDCSNFDLDVHLAATPGNPNSPEPYDAGATINIKTP